MGDWFPKILEKCPKCGKLHLLTPKMCGCGHDFEEESGREGKLLCPRDGTELKYDWFACPKCETPLNDLFRYNCPKCGERVGIKDRYCKCGEELIPNVALCPYCKAVIDAKSIACPKCGKNFYVAENEHAHEEHAAQEYHCATCGCRLPTIDSQCPVCSQQQYSYE